MIFLSDLFVTNTVSYGQYDTASVSRYRTGKRMSWADSFFIQP